MSLSGVAELVPKMALFAVAMLGGAMGVVALVWTVAPSARRISKLLPTGLYRFRPQRKGRTPESARTTIANSNRLISQSDPF